MPLAGTDPARLRSAEGRFKLALEDSQTAVSDLAATLDGARLSGAGVGRPGATTGGATAGCAAQPRPRRHARPARPQRPAAAAARCRRPPCRAGRLRPQPPPGGRQGGLAGADRRAGDPRRRARERQLALRRLALRPGELDAAASGALNRRALRVPDAILELAAPARRWCRCCRTRGPGSRHCWRSRWRSACPAAVRAEAVALRAKAISAPSARRRRGRCDTRRSRGSGTLTLRHRRPRLLAPLLGPEAGAWLGQGSFSLIASLSGQGLFSPARMVTAEHLDLVAGSFRGRGQMTLALDGARPLGHRPLRRRRRRHCLSCRCAGPSRCGWHGRRARCRAGGGGSAGGIRPAPWCWTPPARH